MITKYKEILNNYLPTESIDIIADWIIKYQVSFKIKNSRTSKLGDFRPKHRNFPYRISINKDLNKYSFLITTIHEFSHLFVWEKHKNKVKPHGIEWKEVFKEQMDIFILKNIFPDDILKNLLKYIDNAKATSFSDIELSKILKKYDNISKGVFIGDIGLNEKFTIHNGNIFIKEEKIRTRYKCKCLNSKKNYLFSSGAIVFPLEKQKTTINKENLEKQLLLKI